MKVQCPHCKAVHVCPDEYAGRQVKCNKCNDKFVAARDFEETNLIQAQIVQSSQTKKCPFCAEDIHADAVKCKHCGEFLTEVARNPPSVSTQGDWPNLRLIAARQRLLIRAILLSVFAELPMLVFLIAVPGLGILLALAMVAFRVTITLNLSSAAYRDVAIGVFVSLCVVIPVLGLLAMMFVNMQATSVLKQHGVNVGFMGVDTADMEAIQ